MVAIDASQTLDAPAGPVRRCREIFQQQVACAMRDLDPRALNVHRARKNLKRARATLRLLRPAIADPTYRRENESVRDVARALSEMRDAEVLTDALDTLVKRASAGELDVNLETLRDALRGDRERLASRSQPPEQLAELQDRLQRVIKRASRWTVAKDEWSLLASGFRRTYRRGRRARRAAHKDPTTEMLHDWRKQAKYSWHQLQILTPLAPGRIGELADEFHRLSDYLGDEHDLAVLEQRAFELPHELNEADVRKLKALIEARRDALQSKAFALGDRLYGETPREFLEPIDRCWRRFVEAGGGSEHSSSASPVPSPSAQRPALRLAASSPRR